MTSYNWSKKKEAWAINFATFRKDSTPMTFRSWNLPTPQEDSTSPSVREESPTSTGKDHDLWLSRSGKDRHFCSRSWCNWNFSESINCTKTFQIGRSIQGRPLWRRPEINFKPNCWSKTDFSEMPCCKHEVSAADYRPKQTIATSMIRLQPFLSINSKQHKKTSSMTNLRKE